MKANFREIPRNTRVEAKRLSPLADQVVLPTMAGPQAFPPGSWIVKSRHNSLLFPPMTHEVFKQNFEPIPQEEQDAEVLPEGDDPKGIRAAAPQPPAVLMPEARNRKGLKLM